MSREKYRNAKEARYFLTLEGFKPVPGKWYAFYHVNGNKAAITPINKGVIVIFARR